MSDIDNARDAQRAHRAALLGALAGEPVEPEPAPVQPEPTSSFDGGTGRAENVAPVTSEPIETPGEMWAAILRGQA